MAAVACNEESDGDLGEVGLGIEATTVVVGVVAVLRAAGPVSCVSVLVITDRELMSGDMLSGWQRARYYLTSEHVSGFSMPRQGLYRRECLYLSRACKCATSRAHPAFASIDTWASY
jgi:hypothetical protein